MYQKKDFVSFSVKIKFRTFQRIERTYSNETWQIAILVDQIKANVLHKSPRDYIKSLRSKTLQIENPFYKFVTGESGVGKPCLIKQCCDV